MSLRINRTPNGTLINDMPGGTVFNFTTSKSDNNGLCYRLRDSKVAKGRFAQLEKGGKVLTASDTDRGIIVDAELDFNDQLLLGEETPPITL